MISVQRANATLGYEFGQRPFTPPPKYYLRLSLKQITNGSDFTELDSSIGYAPIEIPNDTNNWSEPVNKVVSNLNQLSFPIFTDGLAESNKVKSWFLTEEISSTTAAYWGDFEEARPVLKDSLIWINPGDLKLQRENPI